jgi:hypothetical protein
MHELLAGAGLDGTASIAIAGPMEVRLWCASRAVNLTPADTSLLETTQ